MIKGNSIEDLQKKVSEFNELVGNGVTNVVTVEAPVVDLRTPASNEDEAPVIADNVIEEPTPIVATPAPVATRTDNGLDAEGLPWDSRIHTVKQSKCKDGTWKIKRGTDKALVLQVKTELRNQTTQPAPVVPQAPTPVVETPVQPTLPVQPVPVVETPVQPVPAPQLPSSNGHTVETFLANFEMIMATLITQKKIDQNYVNQLSDYCGVKEIWEANDEHKKEMFNMFVSNNIITKA